MSENEQSDNSVFNKNEMAKTSLSGIRQNTQLKQDLSSFGTSSLPIATAIANSSNILLPQNDTSNHANLLKRWNFYLQNELTQANQEIMREAINEALTLKDTSGNFVFKEIFFDCVEGAQQTVSVTNEYRLKSSGGGKEDDDDKGLNNLGNNHWFEFSAFSVRCSIGYPRCSSDHP